MKNKKLLSLCLAVIFVISLTSISSAHDSSINNSEVFSVSSPEFPDAYILTSYTPAEISTYSSDGPISLGKISATVFVEEEYALEDGEYVVSNSRLLSKKEVDKIGIENFSDMALADQTQLKDATESRGKLTINLGGYYTTPGNGVHAALTGNAKWEIGYSSIDGGIVAVGEDFIGISWGGHLSPTSDFCQVKIKDLSNGRITYEWPGYADKNANAGRIWGFEEKPTGTSYAMEAIAKVTIGKNTLEGGAGNTTEAVLHYIHTYSAPQGSVSVSIGSVGVSVSGVGKHWTIACSTNKIPY